MAKKATLENIGSTYKIRLVSYTSFRHYGGREITPTEHIADATLVALQDGFQPYVVELNANVKDKGGCLQYAKGHKIAIPENDFAL